MPSVYFTDVTGNGGLTTPYRPAVPAGFSYAVLMIATVSNKAIICSNSDTITGSGITLLLSGATWATLQFGSRHSNPNNPQRAQISLWLTTNGFQPLPPEAVTWYDVIQWAAHEGNPAAQLDETYVN